jgi:hypothetical protein
VVVVEETLQDVEVGVWMLDVVVFPEAEPPAQFRRSNATVPRMLTKWLEMYFQSLGIAVPFSGL